MTTPSSDKSMTTESGTKSEPSKAKAETRSIGMKKTKWSGREMWRCGNCRATTFDEATANTHTCKQVRYASDKG